MLGAGRWKTIGAGLALGVAATAAHASVALLMEEPYGEFGAFNPTGHAAVYLNHVCAETPTQLRMCNPGELGVVISRYHKVNGYDWVAMPLIPYLYAVDTAAEVPASVTKAKVAEIRDAYRREHLLAIAPSTRDDKAPGGEWTQLVGSSYDRTIHGFQVETTREQDERFIALQNDKRNHGHFNLFFHNCADFSRVVLDTYFPHSVHRNFIADAGMTTPKQVAKALVKYSRKHPELKMTAFDIRQVAGSVPRSQKIDGVTESVVKRKRYLLPMVVLMPEFTGAVVVAYLAKGRTDLPKEVSVFEVDAPQMLVGETPAAGSAPPPVSVKDGAPTRSTAGEKPI